MACAPAAGCKSCRCLDIVWCLDTAHSVHSPGGGRPGLRHISAPLMVTVSQFSARQSMRAGVSGGWHNGHTIRWCQAGQRQTPGRMSPGVMELSRDRDGDLRLSWDCVTNEKYSGEDLPGVARGRAWSWHHQPGQNPNINGLPKCALIRQLSWHKECAHAHNSNVRLSLVSWLSVDGAMEQQAPGQRGGGPGSWRKEAASIYINVPN